MILELFRNNKNLISFTFFNILDKAFVFLIPFVVLSLFNAKDQYVQLEYILSTVNILATVTDFGINGYMFFYYQSAKDKLIAITQAKHISELIFLVLVLGSIFIIYVHKYISPLNILIYYILARILFIYITTFFTSYFRLTDKPIKAIYISLSVNVASILLMLWFYLLGFKFSLWLVFIPQILLVCFYSVKIGLGFNLSTFSVRSAGYTLIESLRFSWPSMVQVFLMVFMANYGKLNALDKLSNEDAVFLGYTLRFCMIMQLAHASLVGFYAKAILTGEDQMIISGKILKLYASILLLSCVFVVSIMLFYQVYVIHEQNWGDRFLLVILFCLYTLLWCFYSYLEMYYARINRNSIKLYLTFVILAIFILAIKILQFNLLQNIALAMFLSILGGLIANIWILKRMKFSLI